MVQAFGKHSGKEQRVVANMLAHLALAVERGSQPINRIGLQQQLAYVMQRTAFRIADLVQRIALAELGQQIGYIVLHVIAADARLIIGKSHHLLKELLQRIRFMDHKYTPPLFRLLLTPLPASLPDARQKYSLK